MEYQETDNTLRLCGVEPESIVDGPGFRFVIFVQGCPHHCPGCHNPQSHDFDGGYTVTEDELFDAIKENRHLAGVTFSGGEPLVQEQFLSECLTLLKGSVHTAVQTSGYADQAVFREILAKADLFLFDLKVMDEQNAKRYTGVGSAVILKNFDTLATSGKRFLVRIPLIPEAVATAKNFEDIIRILSFYGIDYAEALPYNKLAGAKYALCGRSYTPDFNPDTPVTPPVELFAKHGITLKIL